MNKGLMQNIAIFLLLLSSLILLSVRFELLIITPTTSGNVLSNRSAINYSVRPNTIILNMGVENSTKISDKNGLYYREISRVLEESIRTRNSVESFTQNNYREKKVSKNIQLIFEPAIDQRLLYGSLFLEDGIFGDFGRIQEILIPQTQDTSIYLKSDDDRYMEIKNSTSNAIAGFQNFSDISYKKYYSIGERFPEFTDNDVLISDEARLSSYVTKPMFDEENADEAIRALLGTRYDFANRISEIDGSTIATYDYGREIVKISPEGKIFYYNKEAKSDRRRTSISEAGRLATSLVNAVVQEQSSYVVEDIKDYKEEAHSGYELYLSQRLEGVRVSLKNDRPSVKVVVINGKVYSMEGIFRIPSVEVDNNLAFGENAVLLMLEQNFEYIKKAEPFESVGELFDKIRSVEYAYIYSADYNYIACYRMLIGNKVFFFKISDAEVVR